MNFFNYITFFLWDLLHLVLSAVPIGVIVYRSFSIHWTFVTLQLVTWAPSTGLTIDYLLLLDTGVRTHLAPLYFASPFQFFSFSALYFIVKLQMEMFRSPVRTNGPARPQSHPRRIRLKVNPLLFSILSCSVGEILVPLTYGSGCGSGSCYFRQWPSRRQQQNVYVFLFISFWRYEVHPKSKWKVCIKREWLQLGG